jgi:hypothetical protein
MFNAVVVYDTTMGYVVEGDPDGVYHRSDLEVGDS